MTIFDNTFLENLKNAIIKCNINKSLISKLLSNHKNIDAHNVENFTTKNMETDTNSDISDEQNNNDSNFSYEENVTNLQSTTETSNEIRSNLETNSNKINTDNSDIYSDLDTIYSNNKDVEQFLFSIIPLIDQYLQDEATKCIQKSARTSIENREFSDLKQISVQDFNSNAKHSFNSSTQIKHNINHSTNTSTEINKSAKNSINKENNQNVGANLEKGQTNSGINNFVENTLIISETQGKVFLPYFMTDLKEISKCNDNMPFNEIIEQKYTLPIANFKSLAISRFREAFKLARHKEKKSFKFAFDLGLEVLFDYNLHPAIIAACRTLDELDIYLDCLDAGETDKFECFDIKFEIPPILIKK